MKNKMGGAARLAERLLYSLGVERADGSKILTFSPYVLSSQGVYFTFSETEFEEILKELTVKELGVELWLTTCLNEELWRKALEAGLSSSIL